MWCGLSQAARAWGLRRCKPHWRPSNEPRALWGLGVCMKQASVRMRSPRAPRHLHTMQALGGQCTRLKG